MVNGIDSAASAYQSTPGAAVPFGSAPETKEDKKERRARAIVASGGAARVAKMLDMEPSRLIGLSDASLTSLVCDYGL
jgi:hypothetical protein